MSTVTKVGSINRAIKIVNARHAANIARTYINDDKYLLMNEDRMKAIVNQLIPKVEDAEIKRKLCMIKEVVEHEVVEQYVMSRI